MIWLTALINTANNHSQDKCLLTKVDRIDVDCASMLHPCMWTTAFLVVDISVSILKKSNLWMHCFCDFVWIRQESLSRCLKKVHVMMQYHMYFEGHAQIKSSLQQLKDIVKSVYYSSDQLHQLHFQGIHERPQAKNPHSIGHTRPMDVLCRVLQRSSKVFFEPSPAWETSTRPRER